MRKFYIVIGIFMVVSLAILLLPLPAATRIWLLLGVLVILILLLVAGASSICSGMFVRARCKGSPGSSHVAITFDDGPHPENSVKILALLESYGVKGSFFLTGARAEIYGDIVEKMSSAGHTVGNHSYSHSVMFPFYGSARITRELERTNRILENATGKPVRFFRPPFGVTNPNLAGGLRAVKLEVAGWSIRSYDTRNEPPQKVIRRITRKLGAGKVILLHESSEHILQILEWLLQMIEREGLQCVSFDQLAD